MPLLPPGTFATRQVRGGAGTAGGPAARGLESPTLRGTPSPNMFSACPSNCFSPRGLIGGQGGARLKVNPVPHQDPSLCPPQPPPRAAQPRSLGSRGAGSGSPDELGRLRGGASWSLPPLDCGPSSAAGRCLRPRKGDLAPRTVLPDVATVWFCSLGRREHLLGGPPLGARGTEQPGGAPAVRASLCSGRAEA